MIQPAHLLVDVIRPALAVVGLGSVAVEQLLLGTAAAESRCGEFLHQDGGGPALGVWQVEPATHEDVWRNVLAFKPALRARVESLVPPFYSGMASQSPAPPPRVLCGNLLYACVIARLVYWRSPAALPQAGDWQGLAAMWKRVYNTTFGAGTTAHFLEAADHCGVLALWPGVER